MITGFDHLILLTADLDKAIADYSALGFEVIQRQDKGKGPSENRLIVFDDGSYLELLMLVEPDYKKAHRFFPLLEYGDGWADYSLVCEDLAEEAAKLSVAGVPFKDPTSYSKTLEDGRPWVVNLLLTGWGVGSHCMPFVVSDGTPRELRVPNAVTTHGNGATGIGSVALVTGDLQALEPGLGALLGAGAPVASPDGAARSLRFGFGDRFLVVHEVAAGPSEMRTHLEARGEGLYSVQLTGGIGSLDAALMHGARMSFA
ncbi:VOC family protein [Acuticoccus mangrovi]|uniref:VOC family protein n=1 Tax=Acuticoccus mangrovi TaxID=2796142 RepID=A0A934IR88_9HYPH|nr:VOC family protein [Acuticoccus mangrovi]MBJ3776797.1 VOC family protein [Acuticoccus mangrovi]